MFEIIGSYNFSQIFLQLLFTCMCIVVDVYFASVQIDSKLVVFQRLSGTLKRFPSTLSVSG